MKADRRRVAGLLAIATLAGCHAGPPAGWVPAHRFTLDAAPADAYRSALVRHEAKGAEATGVSGVPNGALPRPALDHGDGSLVVDLSGALGAAARRLLATVADVDHVVVTLTAPGEPTRTMNVPAAAIADGQTTVTFMGLAPATWAIVVQAFDAGGAVIGETSDTAKVTAGLTTQVALDVLLSPEVAPPSGGGGSSSEGGQPGGVAIGANFCDGPALESPLPLPAMLAADGTFGFGAAGAVYPHHIAIAPGGDVWVGDLRDGWYASGAAADLVNYAPDGTERLRVNFGQAVPGGLSGGPGAMHVDQDGNLWVARKVARELTGDRGVMKLAPDGTQLGHFLKDRHVFSMTAAPGGDLWIEAFAPGGSTHDLIRLGSDGTTKLVRTAPMIPGMGVGVQSDPCGNPWLFDYDYEGGGVPGHLHKYLPALDAFKTFDVEPGLHSMHVDARGRVWLGAYGTDGAGRLLIYSNTGTRLAEVPWPKGLANEMIEQFYMASDRAGRVWVADAMETMRVFDPTTFAVLATYPIPAGRYRGGGMVFDTSGRMWTPDAEAGTILRFPIR